MKSVYLCQIGKESEPFLYCGKWYFFNDMFGPFACTRRGDPLATQPSGRHLQAAYEHWKITLKGAA